VVELIHGLLDAPLRVGADVPTSASAGGHRGGVGDRRWRRRWPMGCAALMRWCASKLTLLLSIRQGWAAQCPVKCLGSQFNWALFASRFFKRALCLWFESVSFFSLLKEGLWDFSQSTTCKNIHTETGYFVS
jgi:hypothetical protein